MYPFSSSNLKHCASVMCQHKSYSLSGHGADLNVPINFLKLRYLQMPTFINRIYFGLHDNIGVPPFLFPFNFSSFSFLFSSFFLSFLVLFLSSIFLSFFLLFSCSPFLFFPFFPPQFCPQDPNFADRSDYWGGVTPPHTPPLGTPLHRVLLLLLLLRLLLLLLLLLSVNMSISHTCYVRFWPNLA